MGRWVAAGLVAALSVTCCSGMQQLQSPGLPDVEIETLKSSLRNTLGAERSQLKVDRDILDMSKKEIEDNKRQIQEDRHQLSANMNQLAADRSEINRMAAEITKLRSQAPASPTESMDLPGQQRVVQENDMMAQKVKEDHALISRIGKENRELRAELHKLQHSQRREEGQMRAQSLEVAHDGFDDQMEMRPMSVDSESMSLARQNSELKRTVTKLQAGIMEFSRMLEADKALLNGMQEKINLDEEHLKVTTKQLENSGETIVRLSAALQAKEAKIRELALKDDKEPQNDEHEMAAKSIEGAHYQRQQLLERKVRDLSQEVQYATARYEQEKAAHTHQNRMMAGIVSQLDEENAKIQAAVRE